MGALSKFALLLAFAAAALLLLATLGHLDSLCRPRKPHLPDTAYWGPGAAPKGGDSEKVKPMTVSVSKEALAELQAKVKSFKFVEPLEGAQFDFGFNGRFTRRLVRHWLEKYSWKEWEQRLNSQPQYQTQIEGLDVHFVRAAPAAGAKRKLPLLLLHGWPGSVLEFHKLIPLLTKPDADGVAFDVVAPSIPGYGWSQAPSKRGFDVVACARIFHKLLRRLGFDKYYVQGGDWGAIIAHVMARHFEDSLLGHHTNMPIQPMGVPSVHLRTLLGAYLPLFSPTDAAKLYPFFGKLSDLLRETGYFHIQATRPDTVGHALQDSPVGLAAYILEKFCVWTVPTDRFSDNCNLDGPSAHFTLDELLTNVMIYWTTKSIVPSMRFYKENLADMSKLAPYQALPSSVPHGVASFRHELSRVPEQLVRLLHPRLLRFTDFAEGGHFAALQLPRQMADEIRSFVRSAEELHSRAAAGGKEAEL